MRVARREMDADIAVAQGPEQRVGERVQDDVAVGMGRDAALVRNAHAAEPDVIAGRESVHVESGADARDKEGRAAAEAALGLGEIGLVA